MSATDPSTGAFDDDDLLLLSALNDFLFCPRRAWLHRVEGVFEHSAQTLEGSFQHERADDGPDTMAEGGRAVRALPLFCRRLGLVGKADVVEFRPGPDGLEVPYPVEYKHGPRRQWDNDDVQVCGQALCLEEMLGVPVPVGAIFHVASKRRREVVFDEALRRTTQETVAGLRALLATGTTPPAVLQPRCDGCSLRAACMPELPSRQGWVEGMVRDLFRTSPEKE